jgi:hypothetical protein
MRLDHCIKITGLDPEDVKEVMAAGGTPEAALELDARLAAELEGIRGQVLAQGFPVDVPGAILIDKDDPLGKAGQWRNAKITAFDEAGQTVELNAGDAVDFMVTRLRSLEQLLGCINAG